MSLTWREVLGRLFLVMMAVTFLGMFPGPSRVEAGRPAVDQKPAFRDRLSFVLPPFYLFQGEGERFQVVRLEFHVEFEPGADLETLKLEDARLREALWGEFQSDSQQDAGVRAEEVVRRYLGGFRGLAGVRVNRQVLQLP